MSRICFFYKKKSVLGRDNSQYKTQLVFTFDMYHIFRYIYLYLYLLIFISITNKSYVVYVAVFF